MFEGYLSLEDIQGATYFVCCFVRFFFLSLLILFVFLGHFFCQRSDEEWSDDEKGGGKEDDLEELDEMQLGELLAKEQRARHMGLSQVRVYGVVFVSVGERATLSLPLLLHLSLYLRFCLYVLSLCFSPSLSLSLYLLPSFLRDA